MKPIKDKWVFYSFFGVLLIFFATACSDGGSGNGDATQETASEEPAGEVAEDTENLDPMKNKGIGPVENVELEPLDDEIATKGKDIFDNNCSACHKIDKRYVGPALQGITERRTPEWIMNMILNPSEMVDKDPIARELLAEYLSPMAKQGLEREEVRAILEYFRKVDTEGLAKEDAQETQNL